MAEHPLIGSQAAAPAPVEEDRARLRLKAQRMQGLELDGMKPAELCALVDSLVQVRHRLFTLDFISKMAPSQFLWLAISPEGIRQKTFG